MPTCLHCGVPLPPRQPRTGGSAKKYCSGRCSSAAYRANEGPRRPYKKRRAGQQAELPPWPPATERGLLERNVRVWALALDDALSLGLLGLVAQRRRLLEEAEQELAESERKEVAG